MYKDQVKEILARVLELEQVDETISIENCSAWDSLKHLAVIMEIEMVLGVEFEPNEIAEANSFDKIVEYIDSKR